MDAVSEIGGDVPGDAAVGRGLNVEAVANIADIVRDNPEAVGIPDMNARSLLAGVLARNAADRTPFDDRAVRLAHVNAEQRVDDAAVANRGTRRGNVDARGIAAEVAAALPIDVEALDRHVGGTHADDAAAARPDEHRAPAADEVNRTIDDQVADVAAGGNFDGCARGRLVDEALDGRCVGGRGTAFHHCCSRRRHPGLTFHPDRKYQGADHGHAVCVMTAGSSSFQARTSAVPSRRTTSASR